MRVRAKSTDPGNDDEGHMNRHNLVEGRVTVHIVCTLFDLII